MSFGPSQAEKTAQQNQTNIANTATANSANQTALGTNSFNTGVGNTASGTNFFNTLLNGNQANTTALLQPNIDQIRQGTQQNLSAISTLMPRGGGRFGSLFGTSLSANPQINNLFQSARSGAANNLANIGLQQQGVGTNLFGIANQGLNTGLAGNQNVNQDTFADRQYSNSMWGQLGAGLFGLATTPFGGGASMNGLLGLI